jgi:hypothetical protein
MSFSFLRIQVGSEDTADNWTEVGKDEFLQAFKDPSKKAF